jgi:1-pyrroline-5-carboxylate dehydrogenase
MYGSIRIPDPKNERVLTYEPVSEERELLRKELKRQEDLFIEIPIIIGGKEIFTKETKSVIMPHKHNKSIGVCSQAGKLEINQAIECSLEAKKKWENLTWHHRAAVFLKIAELISNKYRYVLNAATMLNQSKNPFQAEIDSACELIDFLRYNVKFAEQIFEQQPKSPDATWDYMEYRSLEGFILAISPFNFTAIAGNLTTAPAMLGNTVIWKPSSNALLSGYYLMKIFKEAGLPDGVINFVPSSGKTISQTALIHPELAGVHFTGSTDVFTSIWQNISDNIKKYKSYPRIVGETGGKNYILMHNSGKIDAVVTALIRGAFEYQGQKCSACSRAYIPKSRWLEVKDKLIMNLKTIKMGDVLEFENFMNSVIDEKAYDKTMEFINRAKNSNETKIIFGGNGDKSLGYFIEPTIIVVNNPLYETMREELFAPVLSLYVYEDNEWDNMPELISETTPYALTGSIFSQDPYIIEDFSKKLKNTCGNFYINDKPTGAVVGKQPFGGGRASGTNDKAGSFLNLMRWLSPRTIKECFNPPVDYSYPFMR